MSSLYTAVMRQKIDDVRRIIEENPNSVNEVNSEENKRTPIFAAVFFAGRFVSGLDENILDLLIDSGANVNKMDAYGNNVLHLTALELRVHSRASGYTTISENKVNSIISKLINAGADVMTTNDDGLTPLQHAVYHNNEYVVKALLKNSSEELQQRQLNATNPDGETALDIITEEHSEEITDTLMYYLDSNNTSRLNTSFNNTTDLTDLNAQSFMPSSPNYLPDDDRNDRYRPTSPNYLPDDDRNDRYRPTTPNHPPPNNEMSDENNSQSSQVSMVSRWSERDIYKEIQELQNKSRYPINIAKDVLFNDPIMLSEETINVAEYIAEDKDNIVLKYEDEKYFFTNRSTIEKMYQDDASIFYGCYSADTAIFPRQENVSRRKKYLSLKSIGLIGPNNYCIMNLLLDNTIQQIFYIKNLNYTFESYASEAVLNGGNVVSALHCQAGHKSAISTIVPAYPSIKDDISSNNSSTIPSETNSQTSSQNSSPSFISFWGSDASGNSTQNSENNSSTSGGKNKKTKKNINKKKKSEKKNSKKAKKISKTSKASKTSRLTRKSRTNKTYKIGKKQK